MTPSSNPFVETPMMQTLPQQTFFGRKSMNFLSTIVDRFVPSARLDEKRALYPAPKVLRAWTETPRPGPYLQDQKLSAHELDFWGGDLASAMTRLDHVQRLGADVLYLNPIHLAWTNHKYDAFDFQAISPEYGTRDDFRRLAADARRRGMKVVLDGVFNHMGRNAPRFQQALADPERGMRCAFALGLRSLTLPAVALAFLHMGLIARVTRASVSEALCLLSASPPTVILCDLSMPGVDGYDFLRQQHLLAPSLASIPSVAVTAHAGEADRQHALRAGFGEYLPKPVDLTRLTALIIALHAGAAPVEPSAETPQRARSG